MMIVIIIILRTRQNVECFPNVCTLQLNLVAIKIRISVTPEHTSRLLFHQNV